MPRSFCFAIAKQKEHGTATFSGYVILFMRRWSGIIERLGDHMTIQKDKVVSMHYTLTDDSGAVIDSSKGQDPMDYIQGAGHIIPGLEDALVGKDIGDKVTAVIPPEKAYGERNDSLVQSVPKEEFASVPDLKVGMQFNVQSAGGPMVVSVAKIEDDNVLIDANHPLAGITLHFDVEIMAIRDATEKELADGELEGSCTPGGCCGDDDPNSGGGGGGGCCSDGGCKH